MRKSSIFFALALVLSYLVGCAPKQTVINGLALGTTYHIVICGDTISGLQQQIDEKLETINLSMSIFNDSSQLSKINRNETQELDSMLEQCISLALKVSEQSEGMYDITIKPLSDAWGFAKKQKTLEPNIDSLLQAVGYKKIKITDGKLIKENPNTQIDLNSIAKGAAVDMIAELIESRGHSNYLVEIGGEIFARGLNSEGNLWRVGIDKPFEGNMAVGEHLQEILRFSDKGMATSGNYRRYYTDENGNKIVHTINPKTGYSTTSNLLSATVIAQSCALADAYGTMLMSMGLDAARSFTEVHNEIFVYLIYSNEQGEMNTYSSANLEKWLE